MRSYRAILFAGLLLSVVSWLPKNALAQGWGSVVGRVTEAGAGQALPGITVVVDGTNFGTATEDDGQYRLRIPAGRYALRFSAIGFEAHVDSVVVRRDEVTAMDVTLKPAVLEMDGVTVEAPGHWYKIVGNGVQVTAHTNPFIQPVFDTRISVYTSEDGTEENLTCITAANDDTFDLAESVSWISQAGTTYYLLVHGTAGLLPPFVSEGEYWFIVQN